MELIDGPLYPPEQVSENLWLGKRTAGALRRAAARGQLEHTKSGGKICFSYANIRANQAAWLQPTRVDEPAPPASRRGRRTPAADAQPGVTVLHARPDARRGGRSRGAA